MIRSTGLARAFAVTLLALAAVGCESQKEPAEQAVASLEKSLEAAALQAEKYVPDEIAAARAKVGEMKALLEKQDYKAVVTQAPAVAAELRKVVADSAIAKANFTQQMTQAWTEYAQTLPQAISSVDDRILRYTSGGGLPKGMSRDAFKELVAKFDAAKADWGAAAEAGNAGKYEEAVTKSIEVKRTVEATMEALGLPKA
jgi:hypothetical protein